jgi:hypothetical protein
MAPARSGTSRETEERTEQPHPAEAGSPQPRSPFPRYERIAEDLADERTGTPEPPGEEIPRTESYGELWTRASRWSRRR